MPEAEQYASPATSGSQLNAELNALNSRVDAIEALNSDDDSKIATLANQVTALTTQVSTLTTKVADHESRIGALEQTPTTPPPEPPTIPGPEPPPTRPTWTDRPTVTYESLYQSGDYFEDTLARLTQPAYVSLPAGLDVEINDFSQGGGAYGVYQPLCRGLIGAGPTQTRIKMRKNSSTKLSTIPAQSAGGINRLAMLRLSPGDNTSNATVHCWGFTLAGTDQPIDPRIGIPHSYNGLIDYKGLNSTYENLVIQGIPGDWNAPPGETFQISSYYSQGTLFKNVDSHGFDLAGLRVGCSPFGTNGGKDVVVEDCNFHDAWVSGVTISAAGGPGSLAGATENFTSRRMKISLNAWHTPYVRPGYTGSNYQGKNFGLLNSEGIKGTIRHEYPDMRYAQPTLPACDHHMFMGSWAPVPDAKVILVEPNWHPEAGHLAGTTVHNDAFVVRMPVTYAGTTNSQVTPPTIIKNGVTLQPVMRTGSWPTGVDPTKQFIVDRR